MGALQAVARHAHLESQRLKGGDGALDGMDQEQRPLLALDLVERRHRGAAGVDQHLGQIRLQQGADAVPLGSSGLSFWKQQRQNKLFSLLGVSLQRILTEPRGARSHTTSPARLAGGQLSQLVDGDLPDLPHGHDDVVVPLQSLANLNTHQGVQAQVGQRGVGVQAADITHA